MRNVFKAYRNNPNVALRNHLVEMNIGLARQVAHSIAKTTSEPYEDLEQVAMLGLIIAVERYDLTKELRFSTYAVPTIHGKVLQHLRDKGAVIRMPQSLQDLYIRKLKTETQLRTELGRNPTINELVTTLEVSPEKLARSNLANLNKFPISLSTRIGKSNTIHLEDTIPNINQSDSYKLEDIPDAPLKELKREHADILNDIFLNKSGTCKAAASKSGMSATTIKRKLRTAVEEFAVC